MTPKERAHKSAQAMWENDKASKWIGMQISNMDEGIASLNLTCLLYTSPSPRDVSTSRMPSSA